MQFPDPNTTCIINETGLIYIYTPIFKSSCLIGLYAICHDNIDSIGFTVVVHVIEQRMQSKRMNLINFIRPTKTENNNAYTWTAISLASFPITNVMFAQRPEHIHTLLYGQIKIVVPNGMCGLSNSLDLFSLFSFCGGCLVLLVVYVRF